MDWVAVKKDMLSRLLYPNPVCLLSSRSSDGRTRSLMTITWLTAVTNQGNFICSIKSSRYTAKFLSQSGAIFVLNVPIQGMEDLILAIGSTSGGDVDKFDHFDVATCAPGGGKLKKVGTVPDKTEGQMKKHKTSKKESAMQEVASAAAQSIALRDCVAHVLCRVNDLTEEHGHLLLRCTQLAGWTRRTYWDGRNFIPQVGTDAKPYLTFLGSRTFAYVLPSGSANLPPTGPADV